MKERNKETVRQWLSVLAVLIFGIATCMCITGSINWGIQDNEWVYITSGICTFVVFIYAATVFYKKYIK